MKRGATILFKDRLVVWCRTLGSKQEIACQKLCDYLEAKMRDDRRGSELSPWRHYPRRDIRHYLGSH